MLSASAPPTSPAPRMMKNAIDFRRPLNLI
jgi:hypothetical protein